MTFHAKRIISDLRAALARLEPRPLPRPPRHAETFEPISAARPLFRLA